MRIVKIAVAVVALGGLGFCLAVNLGNAPSKAELDQANRESATILIQALQTFHQGHDVYPSELEALIPHLLATLPTVRPADQSFDYTVRADGGDFTLGYMEAPLGGLPSDAGFEFKGSTKTWTHATY